MSTQSSANLKTPYPLYFDIKLVCMQILKCALSLLRARTRSHTHKSPESTCSLWRNKTTTIARLCGCFYLTLNLLMHSLFHLFILLMSLSLFTAAHTHIYTHAHARVRMRLSAATNIKTPTYAEFIHMKNL